MKRACQLKFFSAFLPPKLLPLHTHHQNSQTRYMPRVPLPVLGNDSICCRPGFESSNLQNRMYGNSHPTDPIRPRRLVLLSNVIIQRMGNANFWLFWHYGCTFSWAIYHYRVSSCCFSGHFSSFRFIFPSSAHVLTVAICYQMYVQIYSGI